MASAWDISGPPPAAQVSRWFEAPAPRPQLRRVRPASADGRLQHRRTYRRSASRAEQLRREQPDPKVLLPGVSFGLANRAGNKRLDAEFSQPALLPSWAAAHHRRAHPSGGSSVGTRPTSAFRLAGERRAATRELSLRPVVVTDSGQIHPHYKTGWQHSGDTPGLAPTMQRWRVLCDNGADLQISRTAADGKLWAAVSGVGLALRARRQGIAAEAVGNGRLYALSLAKKRLALAKLLLPAPPAAATSDTTTASPTLTPAQQMAEQEAALLHLQGEAEQLQQKLFESEACHSRICAKLAVWAALDTLLRRSLARYQIATVWEPQLADLGQQRRMTGERARAQAVQRHNCLLGRARCRDVLGQTAAALSDAEAALAAYPCSPPTLQLLSRLLQKSGRHAEATTAHDRAERIRSKNSKGSGDGAVRDSEAMGTPEAEPDESLSELSCELGREWACGQLSLAWEVALDLVAEHHQSCGLPLLPPTLMKAPTQAETEAGTETGDEERSGGSSQKQFGSRQLIAQWRGGGIYRYWSAWLDLAKGCKEWRHQEDTVALPAFRRALTVAASTSIPTTAGGVGAGTKFPLSTVANTQARHAKLLDAARAAAKSAGSAALARDTGTCERQSKAAAEYTTRALEMEWRAVAEHGLPMRRVLAQLLVAGVEAAEVEEGKLAAAQQGLAHVRRGAEAIASAQAQIAAVVATAEDGASTGRRPAMGTSYWNVMRRSLRHRFAASTAESNTPSKPDEPRAAAVHVPVLVHTRSSRQRWDNHLGALSAESSVTGGSSGSQQEDAAEVATNRVHLSHPASQEPLALCLSLDWVLAREIGCLVDDCWRQCIQRVVAAASSAGDICRAVATEGTVPAADDADVYAARKAGGGGGVDARVAWEILAWQLRPAFMAANTASADWEAVWQERIMNVAAACIAAGTPSTSIQRKPRAGPVVVGAEYGQWPLQLGLTRHVLAWLTPPDVLIGCAGTCKALRHAAAVDDPSSSSSSSSKDAGLWRQMQHLHMRSVRHTAALVDAAGLDKRDAAGKDRITQLLAQVRSAFQPGKCDGGDVITITLETRPCRLLQVVAAAAWQLHLLVRCRNDQAAAALEVAQVQAMPARMRWRAHREGGLRALITKRLLEPACPEGAALFCRAPCESRAALEAAVARLLPYVASLLTYATEAGTCSSSIKEHSSSVHEGGERVAMALVPFILAADVQLRRWAGTLPVEAAAIHAEGCAARVAAFCAVAGGTSPPE